MTEAQGQAAPTDGPAGSEATEGTQVHSQDSGSSANEGRTLTWEEHTRELQRIAKKEKEQGRKTRRASDLEALGFDDFDSLSEFVQGYRALEQENETAADKLQKEIAKLQPKAEKAARYEEALTSLLEKERDGLPEHITSLLDGRDPDEQLAWIAANREAIAESSAKPATVGRGSAPGPATPSLSPDDAQGQMGNALLGFLTTQREKPRGSPFG